MCAVVALQYELILSASDSLNENYTKIRITVRDVNDLPPIFPEKFYTKVMDEEIAAPFRMIQVQSHTNTLSILLSPMHTITNKKIQFSLSPTNIRIELFVYKH